MLAATYPALATVVTKYAESLGNRIVPVPKPYGRTPTEQERETLMQYAIDYIGGHEAAGAVNAFYQWTDAFGLDVTTTDMDRWNFDEDEDKSPEDLERRKEWFNRYDPPMIVPFLEALRVFRHEVIDHAVGVQEAVLHGEKRAAVVMGVYVPR